MYKINHKIVEFILKFSHYIRSSKAWYGRLNDSNQVLVMADSNMSMLVKNWKEIRKIEKNQFQI